MNEWSQVFVGNAGGPVNLNNLSISASSIQLVFAPGFSESLSGLCQAGQVGDFSGIRFQNASGTFKHLSLSGQGASSLAPGTTGPPSFPSCGSGIEISSGVAVENSTVYGGQYGIAGGLSVTHSIVSAFGPYSVGITGADTIEDNTVILTGDTDSVGIQGGEMVRGNVVQGAATGIAGAGEVKHNTLINNFIGISGSRASDNLISAQPAYIDPLCPNPNAPSPACMKPTVGIDLKCQDASVVRDNGIVNAGIGMSDIPIGDTLSTTNLFAGVGITSTTCSE